MPAHFAITLYTANKNETTAIPKPNPTAKRKGLLLFDTMTSKLSLSNL